ncbi:MAG: cysteine desulfurase [Nitrospirae bacterium]|nr:cysteine desulfurase [Nitrospirota bacterium]
MIYLDNNATTPIDPEVKEAIIKGLESFGNPSSVHIFGRKAREVIESSRAKVAGLINASDEEVFFTSGGTEANNMAIIGYCLNFGKGHIISSLIEHPSVLQPLSYLQELGFSITLLKPDSEGIISPEDVQRTLRPDTILVTIMHANNETGVIQPIEEIGEILKGHDAVFHTDAAQSIGKIEVDVNAMGVDLLTVVSHKFYGPKGIGALYVRKGIRLRRILHGAGHERGLRPGTENTPLIAGLGKAAEIARRDHGKRKEHLKEITETLFEELQKLIPGTKLNGSYIKRLPNTLNLRFSGIEAHKLVEALSEQVAISAGSACHEGKYTPSDVLISMGLDTEDALSSVRISTGKDNTMEEMKEAAWLISEAIKKL